MCDAYITLFQVLEENIVTFLKKELKKMQKVLSPDDQECVDGQLEENEELEGEDEEQRRSSREALVKITVFFLRRMKQNELSEHLQSSKNIGCCFQMYQANLYVLQ